MSHTPATGWMAGCRRNRSRRSSRIQFGAINCYLVHCRTIQLVHGGFMGMWRRTTCNKLAKTNTHSDSSAAALTSIRAEDSLVEWWSSSYVEYPRAQPTHMRRRSNDPIADTRKLPLAVPRCMEWNGRERVHRRIFKGV